MNSYSTVEYRIFLLLGVSSTGHLFFLHSGKESKNFFKSPHEILWNSYTRAAAEDRLRHWMTGKWRLAALAVSCRTFLAWLKPRWCPSPGSRTCASWSHKRTRRLPAPTTPAAKKQKEGKGIRTERKKNQSVLIRHVLETLSMLRIYCERAAVTTSILSRCTHWWIHLLNLVQY